MCKLGFDICLKELTADELTFCQTAVANWKRLQSAIMDGDQYRLVSPYDKTEKALKRSCFKAFIWWSIAGSNR